MRFAIRALWLASIAALALGAGCRQTTRHEHTAPAHAPRAEQHAAPHASSEQAPAAVAERNRDRHGPPTVDNYVRSLESAARVADLDVPTVLEKLALAPDATVADVGCGPGVFSRAFAKALPHGLVYAVDVEPRQLDRLREHLIEERLENVVPVLASYSTPHLPLGSCDVIFIADTYHHFDDRVSYVRSLARFLEPGGRLAILEYKPGPLPVGPPPDHKLKPGELEHELTAAGYERVAKYDTHANHDFEVWRVRP
ncbi:MAG: class I SAM-dependent methyltransferase [Planctomycetes bacterium]|nr:class I SAM-dependent methyltransferase [Planctomycetota bacterium]